MNATTSRFRTWTASVAGALLLLTATAAARAARLDATQPSTPSAAPTQLVVITNHDAKPMPIAGKWAATFPTDSRAYTVELATKNGKTTGAFKLGDNNLELLDSHVEGNKARFTVKSPDGNRMIVFDGEAKGDVLTFTRTVTVAPKGLSGGSGLFGVDGAKTFTARRIK